MGSYKTSSGDRIDQAQLDRYIRGAKAKKIEDFKDDHGYVFCEDCKRSDVFPIDCSHDISVNEAKNSGRAELCYDVNNITLRCRKCHQKWDKSGLRFGDA